MVKFLWGVIVVSSLVCEASSGLAPRELIRVPATQVYKAWQAERRVLLYIAKHMHTDSVAIFGMTATLNEAMADVLINNPSNRKKMETLLRQDVWADKAKISKFAADSKNKFLHYELTHFFISDPSLSIYLSKEPSPVAEKDDWEMWEWDYEKRRHWPFYNLPTFLTRAISASSKLKFLNGYVYLVKEENGVEKFFDQHDKDVILVAEELLEAGVTSNCVFAAEGMACDLLYSAIMDYYNGEYIDEKILGYFDGELDKLSGDGIVVTEMEQELAIDALDTHLAELRAKLASDPKHYLHLVEKKQTVHADKQMEVYFLPASQD